MLQDHAASPATWDQHRGVELGKFGMQNGRNVFVLRTDRSSVLVTARGILT